MSKLKNFVKENYEVILCFFLFITIILVTISPSKYITTTFFGIKTWATIVLPSLFFFFILTKLLMQSKTSFIITSSFDKAFSKLYNVKNYSGYIFLMSSLSGYPLGAKLTYEFYNQKLITKNEAKRLLSFCSTSGPMFIIGSVGVGLFLNQKLGIIIFLSHILSALINGLIYRKRDKEEKYKEDENKLIYKKENLPTIKKENLNDIMYNTIISVLMIGGYITICFAFLEVISSLQILNLINVPILQSIIKGIIEVTNGCVSLSTINCSIKVLCVIITSLISFGGISIHLQNYMFFSKIGISYKYFLLTKVTHTIISIILSSIFSAIFL